MWADTAKRSRDAKASRGGIKRTALTALFFFLASDFGFAQSFHAWNPSGPGEHQFPVPMSVAIPEELGTIENAHRVPDSKALIVHIHDAHAVVDAQQNIQKLITYLQKEYGIRVIALEGGSGKMDPVFFRAFPHEGLKNKVMDEYLRHGELTGAQMAAIQGPDKGTYYGLEDWDLYEVNYLAYLSAVQNKDALLSHLEEKKKALDAARPRIYSSAHNAFHENREAFENEQSRLIQFLQYAAHQKDFQLPYPDAYPLLSDMFNSLILESAINQEKLNREVRSLARHFEKKYGGELSTRQAKDFHEKEQAFLTGRMETGMFLRFLTGLGKTLGLRPKLTPSMDKTLLLTETFSRMRGTRLYDELQSYLEQTAESFIKTPEQKELDRNYRHIKTLKNLASLELSREEFDRFQNDSADYLAHLDSDALQALIFPAMEFYRLARARDIAFQKNLRSILEREKAHSAIVVTGGFHGAGFENSLREQGLSYVQISPKIHSMEGLDLYPGLMQGKLSYLKYFKTTLYEAFMRHAGEKLIRAADQKGAGKILKLWNDEIIRRLASEGRISEAGRYTRLTRLLYDTYQKEAGFVNSEALGDEFGSQSEMIAGEFREEIFQRLWKRLRLQIGELTSGLKSMIERQELGAENLSALFEKVSGVKPYALGLHLANLTPGLEFRRPPLRKLITTGVMPPPQSSFQIQTQRPPASEIRNARSELRIYTDLQSLERDIVKLEDEIRSAGLGKIPRIGFHGEAAGHLPAGEFWYFISDPNLQDYWRSEWQGIQGLDAMIKLRKRQISLNDVFMASEEFFERLQGTLLFTARYGRFSLSGGVLPEIYLLRELKDKQFHLIESGTKPDTTVGGVYHPDKGMMNYRFFFVEGRQDWKNIPPEAVYEKLSLDPEELAPMLPWARAHTGSLIGADIPAAEYFAVRLLYKKTLEAVLKLAVREEQREREKQFPDLKNLQFLESVSGTTWRLIDQTNGKHWYLKVDGLLAPEKLGYMLAGIAGANLPAWTDVSMADISGMKIHDDFYDHSEQFTAEFNQERKQAVMEQWQHFIAKLKAKFQTEDLSQIKGLLTADVEEMSQNELAQPETTGVEEALVFLVFAYGSDIEWGRNIARKEIKDRIRYILYDLASAGFQGLAEETENEYQIDPRFVIDGLRSGLDAQRIVEAAGKYLKMNLEEFRRLVLDQTGLEISIEGYQKRQRLLKDHLIQGLRESLETRRLVSSMLPMYGRLKHPPYYYTNHLLHDYAYGSALWKNILKDLLREEGFGVFNRLIEAGGEEVVDFAYHEHPYLYDAFMFITAFLESAIKIIPEYNDDLNKTKKEGQRLVARIRRAAAHVQDIDYTKTKLFGELETVISYIEKLLPEGEKTTGLSEIRKSAQEIYEEARDWLEIRKGYNIANLNIHQLIAEAVNDLLKQAQSGQAGMGTMPTLLGLNPRQAVEAMASVQMMMGFDTESPDLMTQIQEQAAVGYFQALLSEIKTLKEQSSRSASPPPSAAITQEKPWEEIDDIKARRLSGLRRKNLERISEKIRDLSGEEGLYEIQKWMQITKDTGIRKEIDDRIRQIISEERRQERSSELLDRQLQRLQRSLELLAQKELQLRFAELMKRIQERIQSFLEFYSKYERGLFTADISEELRTTLDGMAHGHLYDGAMVRVQDERVRLEDPDSLEQGDFLVDSASQTIYLVVGDNALMRWNPTGQRHEHLQLDESNAALLGSFKKVVESENQRRPAKRDARPEWRSAEESSIDENSELWKGILEDAKNAGIGKILNILHMMRTLGLRKDGDPYEVKIIERINNAAGGKIGPLQRRSVTELIERLYRALQEEYEKRVQAIALALKELEADKKAQQIAIDIPEILNTMIQKRRKQRETAWSLLFSARWFYDNVRYTNERRVKKIIRSHGGHLEDLSLLLRIVKEMGKEIAASRSYPPLVSQPVILRVFIRPKSDYPKVRASAADSDLYEARRMLEESALQPADAQVTAEEAKSWNELYAKLGGALDSEFKKRRLSDHRKLYESLTQRIIEWFWTVSDSRENYQERISLVSRTLRRMLADTQGSEIAMADLRDLERGQNLLAALEKHMGLPVTGNRELMEALLAEMSVRTRSEARQTKAFDKNPLQRSRLDQIRTQTGMIDPSSEIARLVEFLARQALGDFGLPESEYAIVIADSDEINAAFYAAEGEKVIEFNWGLLQFLKNHGILNKDTVKFIIGHEAGHSMTKEKEKQESDYRHSRLSDEYRADEYGLAAVDKGDGERAYTPLAGLRLIDALRREQKTMTITLTHPHTHRRQVKIFNDIRHNYWKNLGGETEDIPAKTLVIPRSKRFYFDEALYQNLSLENLRQSIERAGSYQDLLKLIHLFNILFPLHVMLEELASPADLGLAMNLDLSDDNLNGLLQDTGRAYIIRFLENEHVTGEEYLRLDSAQIQLLKRAALNMKTDYNALVLKLLAQQVSMALDAPRMSFTENFRRLSSYAIAHPMTPKPEDAASDLQTKFWRKMVDAYREEQTGLKEKIQKKILELIPELESLGAHDRDQLVEYGFLGGLEYLEGKEASEKQYNFLRELKWQNPVAVLEILIKHDRAYDNDYLKTRRDQKWLSEIYHREHSMLIGSSTSFETFRGHYMHHLIMAVYDDVRKMTANLPRDALVKLYKVYLEHKNVLPKVYDLHYVKEQNYGADLLELLLKKIESFSSFQAIFLELDPWIEDEFSDLNEIAGWIAQAASGEELVNALRFMVSQPKLTDSAVRNFKYFMLKLLTWKTPEEAIRILDGVLEEARLEQSWLDPDYDTGSRRSERPRHFAAAYAVLIGRITDLKRRREMILKYYGKYNHEVQFDTMDKDIPQLEISEELVTLLQKTLGEEGMSPYEQLVYFIDHGFIPEHKLVDSVKNPGDREALFERLLQKQPVYADRRVEEKQYNDMVSVIAWQWFFPTGHIPEYTTKLEKRNLVAGGNLSMLKTVVTERRPVHTLKAFVKKLRASRWNEWLFSDFYPRFAFSEMSEDDFEILFALTSRFGRRGRGGPRLGFHSKGYDEFKDAKGEPYQDYQQEKKDYAAVWARSEGDTASGFSLKWGNELYAMWLDRHPGASLEQKIGILLRAFPEKTEYRNNLLITLFGDPLRDSPLLFEPIFEHLDESIIKSVLAKRILLEKKRSGLLKLNTYEDVRSVIQAYFPKDSEIGRELFNQFLQDAEMTLQELKDHQGDNELDQMARDWKKTLLHEILEYMADDLERRTPEDKREIFEWLSGIRPEKPVLAQYYEYLLKVDLSDLARLLHMGSERERYMFLAILFTGPNGILASQDKRQELIKGIFEYAANEAAEPGNTLYLIFSELFEASPELKQLDLMHGVFEHFLNRKPGENGNRNLLIRAVLTKFGVVGVKLGQILSKQNFLADADLRSTLEQLSDDVAALDKRYLLNALLFDHSLESIQLIISKIGRLLGSASIKQVYEIFLSDGTKGALKYIRPLAHYEVAENLSILKSVIARLRSRISALNQISEALIDEIEKAVRRELDIQSEIQNQRAIRGFAGGEKKGSWTLEIPAIDDALQGTHFFTDAYVENGKPLKESVIQELGGEFETVGLLILQSLLRQMLVLGRYHADLHAGNILIEKTGEPGGAVHLLDFGNSAGLSPENQEAFILLAAALDSLDSRYAISLIRQMLPPGADLKRAARRQLSKVIMSRKLSVEVKLQRIKKILDADGMSFQGEFEVLFKVFETIRYITDRLEAPGKRNLFYQIIFERQSKSLGRLFSETTFRLGMSQIRKWTQGTAARSEQRSSGSESEEPFQTGFIPPVSPDQIVQLELTANEVTLILPQLALVFEAMRARGIEVRAFGGAVRGLAFATQFDSLLPISEIDLAVPSRYIMGSQADFELLMAAQKDYEQRVPKREVRYGQALDHLELHHTDETAFSMILKQDLEWSISKFWLEFEGESKKFLLKGAQAWIDDLKSKTLRLRGEAFTDPLRVPKLLDQALQYLRFVFTVDRESLEKFDRELYREIYKDARYQPVRAEIEKKLMELKEKTGGQAETSPETGAASSEASGRDAKELLQWIFSPLGDSNQKRLAALHQEYLANRIFFEDGGFVYEHEADHLVTYYHKDVPQVLKAFKNAGPLQSVFGDVEYGSRVGRGVFAPYVIVPHELIRENQIPLPEDRGDLYYEFGWMIQELAFSVQDHLYFLKSRWDKARESAREAEIQAIEKDIQLVIQEWERLQYRGWAMGILLRDRTFENAGITATGQVLQLEPAFDSSWMRFFSGSTSIAELSNHVNRKWLSELFGEENAGRLYPGLKKEFFDILWPSLKDSPVESKPLGFTSQAPILRTREAAKFIEEFMRSVKESEKKNGGRSERRIPEDGKAVDKSYPLARRIVKAMASGKVNVVGFAGREPFEALADVLKGISSVDLNQSGKRSQIINTLRGWEKNTLVAARKNLRAQIKRLHVPSSVNSPASGQPFLPKENQDVSRHVQTLVKKGWISPDEVERFVNRVYHRAQSSVGSAAESIAVEALKIEPWFIESMAQRLHTLGDSHPRLNLVVQLPEDDSVQKDMIEALLESDDASDLTLLYDPGKSKPASLWSRAGLVFSTQTFKGLHALGGSLNDLRKKSDIYGKAPVFVFDENLPQAGKVGDLGWNAIITQISEIPASHKTLRKFLFKLAVKILRLLAAEEIKKAADSLSLLKQFLEQAELDFVLEGFQFDQKTPVANTLALIRALTQAQQAVKRSA